LGKLFIIGTPIGNLSDITLRAIETLKSAGLIACEDTRRTRILLAKYGIPGRLISLHAHSGETKIAKLMDAVEAGAEVAYVTDAGMPTLSDPGHKIVAAAMERGIKVEVIPGVSALTTALAYAPFTAQRFAFEGFLSRKGRERTDRLREIAARDHPSVIFEAPGRVEKLIEDLWDSCGGERRVLAAREMTKKFEEILIFKLGSPPEAGIMNKGEFTIVVEGTGDETKIAEANLNDWESAVEIMKSAGMTRRDILLVLKALHPRAASLVRNRVLKDD
jgi:16S rRNA (cytidine1402-2'-O)-methyltransferase